MEQLFSKREKTEKGDRQSSLFEKLGIKEKSRQSSLFEKLGIKEKPRQSSFPSTLFEKLNIKTTQPKKSSSLENKTDLFSKLGIKPKESHTALEKLIGKPRKTTTQNAISKLLSEPHTTTENISRIKIDDVNRILTNRNFTKRQKVKQLSKLGSIADVFVSIKSNMKSFLYYATLTTLTATLTVLTTTYGMGGSWIDLLKGLSDIGINYVPSFIVGIFQSFGISIGSNVLIPNFIDHLQKNPQIKKLLEVRIEPKFLKNISSKFGVDISKKDLTVKKLLKTSISNGIPLGIAGMTGGLPIYFTGKAVQYSITYVPKILKSTTKIILGGGKSISQKTVNTLKSTKQSLYNLISVFEKVPDIVSEEVFSASVTEEVSKGLDIERDALQLTQKVEEILKDDIKKIDDQNVFFGEEVQIMDDVIIHEDVEDVIPPLLSKTPIFLDEPAQEEEIIGEYEDIIVHHDVEEEVIPYGKVGPIKFFKPHKAEDIQTEEDIDKYIEIINVSPVTDVKEIDENEESIIAKRKRGKEEMTLEVEESSIFIEPQPRKSISIKKLQIPSIKKSKFKTSVENVQVEDSKSLLESINDNKLLTTATIVAGSLIAFAASSNQDILGELFTQHLNVISGGSSMIYTGVAKILSASTDFIEHHDLIRKLLFSQLVSSSGVPSLFNKLFKYLTSSQVSKINDILQKIHESTTSDSQKVILMKTFFEILFGGTFHSSKSLQKMNMASLIEIASEKNITHPQNISKSHLIQLILDAQSQRYKDITETFTVILVQGSINKAGTNIVESLYQNISYDDITQKLQTLYTQYGVSNVDNIHTKSSLEEPSLEEPHIESGQQQFVLGEGSQIESKTETLRKLRETQKTQLEAQRIEEEAQTERSRLAQERLSERLAQRDLQRSLQLEDLAKKMGVVIADDGGLLHPVPPDSELLHPDIMKELEGLEFTPLMEYVTKEALSYSTSWIPGVGWINAGIKKVNYMANAAETIKDTTKILNIIQKVRGGISVEQETLSTFDNLLKLRLPTLSEAIDNTIKTHTINAKTAVLESLRDQHIHGWSMDDLAKNIAFKFLGNPQDVSFDVNGLSESTTVNFGMQVLEQMRGIL